MRASFFGVSLLAGLGGLVACNSISGLDDYTFDRDAGSAGTGGASGATAGGTAGSSGGATGGKSGGGGKNDGGAAGNGASGGASAGSGGTNAGNGGANAGSGGAIAGSGGSNAGNGGTSAGSAGNTAGQAGAAGNTAQAGNGGAAGTSGTAGAAGNGGASGSSASCVTSTTKTCAGKVLSSCPAGQLETTTCAAHETCDPDAGCIHATRIFGGATHACAIMSDTTVTCWGHDGAGQLGLGSGGKPGNKSLPGRVRASAAGTPLLRNVKQLALGGSATCAVVDDGVSPPKVLCWGADGSGQLGDGTSDTSRNRPALNQPVTFPGDTVATSDKIVLSSGSDTTCAVSATGKVFCWGAGTTGQLGNGASTVSSAVPVQVINVADASTVAVGGYHVCATRSQSGAGNRRVSCWGQQWSGSLGDGVQEISQSSTPHTALDGTTSADLVSLEESTLAAGGDTIGSGGYDYVGSTCLVRQGELLCWGFNGQGQLGLGVGGSRSKAAATSKTAGSPLSGAPAFLANQVALSWGHSCARGVDRRVFCWGANDAGELGVATPKQSNLPIAFPLAADDLAVGASVKFVQTEDGYDSYAAGYTCALDATSGAVVCLGANNFGQLGVLDGAAPNTPVQMP